VGLFLSEKKTERGEKEESGEKRRAG